MVGRTEVPAGASAPLRKAIERSRKAFLDQITALRRKRKSGPLNWEDSTNAVDPLALQIQFYCRCLSRLGQDPLESSRWATTHRPGLAWITDSARQAAIFIVHLEGGRPDRLHKTTRLKRMRQRVEDLLSREGGSEWSHFALNPAMTQVLADAGLIPRAMKFPPPMSFKMIPVPERSEEMKKLAAILKEPELVASRLDVEEPARPGAKRPFEPEWDADEAIAAYQKRIFRAVRLLYRHGEIHSPLLRDIECTLDLKVIDANPENLIRDDIDFVLRSVLLGHRHHHVGREIVKILEKAGVLGAAKNCRLVMRWLEEKPAIDAHTAKKLAAFSELLSKGKDVGLPGDEGKSLSESELPNLARTHRLHIRRSFRLLVHLGLIKADRWREMKKFVGLPLIGSIG